MSARAYISAAAVMLSGVIFADDEQSAASTYIAIESETIESKGWLRQPVLVSGDGELIDASGTIVSVAETAAVDAATAEVNEISSNALEAVSGVAGELTTATNGMARYCKSYALAIKPETARQNLTGFVVKEETNGATDIQWVWYNKTLPLAPVRWVDYIGDYVTNSVKAAWVDWNASGETITINGESWSGCHKCKITRPSWAVNVPCVTLPNEIFGSQSGFDLGDANLTIDSAVPFTGIVTNQLRAVVETYDNGILKERVSL